MTQIDSIESLGHPLGFKVEQGTKRPGVLGLDPARDVIIIEARRLEGHQKEGVISEGEAGSSWRVATDEDGHLRGTDLAPFPLGYFNAGLHGDFTNRVRALADRRSIEIRDMSLELDTGYSMSGSFFKGTGEGFAEPAQIGLYLDSPASTAELQRLAVDAVDASPALASMRTPVANTFAIYVNGRRRDVTTMRPSPASDAPDPFVTYGAAPEPLESSSYMPDIIYKTGQKSEGVPVVAPGDMTVRQIRPVIGRSRQLNAPGALEADVVLGMPGASNFALKTDERTTADAAPCGLSLLSAGIAFCYMTQLSRYIEYQKFDIRGIRLVQYTPYTMRVEGERSIGGLEPADTHLFLSGDEDDETMERFMKIAEKTCYLHATLSGALEPKVTVHHA